MRLFRKQGWGMTHSFYRSRRRAVFGLFRAFDREARRAALIAKYTLGYN